MKLLTNFERDLQWLFYPENAYRKPPVILKIVPEADYDTFTGENPPKSLEAKTKMDQWQRRKARIKF
jgi:hypothetical protein